VPIGAGRAAGSADRGLARAPRKAINLLQGRNDRVPQGRKAGPDDSAIGQQAAQEAQRRHRAGPVPGESFAVDQVNPPIA